MIRMTSLILAGNEIVEPILHKGQAWLRISDKPGQSYCIHLDGDSAQKMYGALGALIQQRQIEYAESADSAPMPDELPAVEV